MELRMQLQVFSLALDLLLGWHSTKNMGTDQAGQRARPRGTRKGTPFPVHMWTPRGCGRRGWPPSCWGSFGKSLHSGGQATVHHPDSLALPGGPSCSFPSLLSGLPILNT